MEITLTKVEKNYGYQSILKNINLQLASGTVTGITGPNGSGKSTLLKIVSSFLSPSKGKVEYSDHGKPLPAVELYRRVSYAAPYIETTQEFNLQEQFDFHRSFKPLLMPMTYGAFLETLMLDDPGEKQIRFFSSGMKQKIYLALAILSKTDILLLDEPTSFLDIEAKKWWKTLLEAHIKGRLVVIASNDLEDLELAATTHRISRGRLL